MFVADKEDLSVPLQGGTSVAMGVLTALIVGAASLVLDIVPWQQLGISLTAVLSVFGLGFIYTRSLASATVGSRGRLVAAIAMVGFAPVIGHAALRALDRPISAATGPDPADVAAAALMALLCFVLACSVAWRFAARPHPKMASVGRAVTLATVVASVLLTVVTAIHVRGRPSVTTYADGLPMVASLPSTQAEVRGFSEVRPLATEVSDGTFALGRTCIGSGCYVHVRRGEIVRTIGPRLERRAALRLHHDPAATTVVLVADDQVIASMDDSLDNMGWTILSAASIGAHVSPPSSFIGLALIAMLGAVLALMWRRSLRRNIGLLERARDGFVGGNGWLLCEDGRPRRVLDSDVDDGPVIVIDGSEQRACAYRGDRGDSPIRLRHGVRRVLIDRLLLDVAMVDAMTCSGVLALSAPLVVAAAVGLMG